MKSRASAAMRRVLALIYVLVWLAASTAVAGGLGDFDGDGRDEVLLRHEDGSWAVQYMTGESVTVRTRRLEMTQDKDWQFAAIGDIDRDGKDDVLLRHVDTRRWIYFKGSRNLNFGAGVPFTNSRKWQIANLWSNGRGVVIEDPDEPDDGNQCNGDECDENDEGSENREFRDRLRSGDQAPLMISLNAGSFTMGCQASTCPSDERPAHRVAIDYRFAIGKYEVAKSEYDACVADGGCSERGRTGDEGNLPARSLSRHAAEKYAEWLSEQTGENYRLPTEAEWEYAARAGTRTKYFWGDSIGRNRANCSNSQCGDSYSAAAPVGSFAANPWGIHDMHGNVDEWVADCYHPNYSGAPTDGSAWLGERSCSRGVVRGGSYGYSANGVVSSGRENQNLRSRYSDTGFRLVRELESDRGNNDPDQSGSLARFQNFHVIAHDLSESQSHDAECKSQLGSGFRLADWDDLVGYYETGGSLDDLKTGLRMAVEGRDREPGEISTDYRISRGGKSIHSGRRHYFFARHDHNKPSYFAAHDHIDNYHLTLGSWHGTGGHALCYESNNDDEGNNDVGNSFRDSLPGGGEGPEMVVIPSGSFRMGCLSGDSSCRSDEFPVREVEIGYQFALSKYEVTFDQWDACVSGGGCGGRRLNDKGWGRGDRPVINVSWRDAKAYVAWLSEQTGEEYRLPSESEWEYAARAGTETKYHWGNEIGRNNANCDGCGSEWDARRTAPAGSFAPNAFGLHDMHGNVWELVEDCRNSSYNVAPTDGSAWLSRNCPGPVMRGGSWSNGPSASLRAAYRFRFPISYVHNDIGFRVARRVSRTLAP